MLGNHYNEDVIEDTHFGENRLLLQLLNETCPEEICPSFLLGNGNCEPRCNIEGCGFDSGDCPDLNTDNGDQFAPAMFYAVVGIAGTFIFISAVKGVCTTSVGCLGMSPWERIQVFFGCKSREDITGEPDSEAQDGTEPDADDDGVQVARTVGMAEEVHSSRRGNHDREEEMEGVEEEEQDEEMGILPLANRASIDSGLLPTAAELRLSGTLEQLEQLRRGQTTDENVVVEIEATGENAQESNPSSSAAPRDNEHSL